MKGSVSLIHCFFDLLKSIFIKMFAIKRNLFYNDIRILSESESK